MQFPDVDPITRLAFSVQAHKGVYAVLLGSGVSSSAAIPTGWQITLDLVRRLARGSKIEEQPDWAVWYRSVYAREPNYSELVKAVGKTPDERRSILEPYIEPSEQDRQDGKKVPTQAHHAIAKLVESGHIRVILTTNFDRLMENALGKLSIEPTVVDSPDSLKGAQPLIHSRCYLVKLHGDYKDSRILNTEAELARYAKSIDKLLDRVLDEHVLIVCGWSGEWDLALRSAIQRAPNRRYTTYWASRGALKGAAIDLASHRAAEVMVDYDANTLFEQLQQRVELIEESQQNHPVSIELLVRSVKHHVVFPESRVKLDELFDREVLRLEARVLAIPVERGKGDPETEYRKRVTGYEVMAEPLARMMCALGRWGIGDDILIAERVVRRLYRRTTTQPTVSSATWLGLRTYPVVLLVEAFGVGLLSAGRLAELHRFLSADVANEHHEPSPLVQRLFLDVSPSGDRDEWRRVYGHSPAPMSDHLCEILNEWLGEHAGSDSEFELLHSRFEYLGSLVHFACNAGDAFQLEFLVNHDERGTFMPAGRCASKPYLAKLVTEEWRGQRARQALLESGFARGEAEVYEHFCENFKRVGRYLR